MDLRFYNKLNIKALMSYCWSFEYEIDDAEEAIPIGLSFLPFVRGKEKATGMASLASAVEAGK